MTIDNVTRKTTEAYNQIAERYAERWFNFSLSKPLDQFTTYVKSDGLVLDVGAGPGRDALALQERGYQVIGLDRSSSMIQEGVKRGVGPYVLADMRHLPFADHTFNGIWAAASMLHLPKEDLLQALKEVYRVLNHGHVYLSLKEGQTALWQRVGETSERFFAFYHQAEVELALERAGFHVLWLDLTPDSSDRGYRWISAIGRTKLNKVAAGANAAVFE